MPNVGDGCPFGGSNCTGGSSAYAGHYYHPWTDTGVGGDGNGRYWGMAADTGPNMPQATDVTGTEYHYDSFGNVLQQKAGGANYSLIMSTILMVTLQLLAACNGPLRTQISPKNCDQLLETSTRQVLSAQVANPEQIAHAVSIAYDELRGQVVMYDEPSLDTDSRTILMWESDNRAYRMDITNDQLSEFWIGYRSQEPNVNNILFCLGAPESYLAWYGLGTGESGMGLLLMLFYPQQGVIAKTNVSIQFADASEVTSSMTTDAAQLPVSGLRFSQPKTTSTELLQDYLAIDLTMDFAQEPGKSLLPWYEQLLWPWPGDVHQLEYSTLSYPEMPLVPNQPSP